MPGMTAVPAADAATRLTLLVDVIQTFTAYPTVIARFGIKQALKTKARGQTVFELEHLEKLLDDLESYACVCRQAFQQGVTHGAGWGPKTAACWQVVVG